MEADGSIYKFLAKHHLLFIRPYETFEPKSFIAELEVRKSVEV